VFERLLALRNDVGLMAEEYDPRARRFLGNFPQAFSHVALIDQYRPKLDARCRGNSCASARQRRIDAKLSDVLP
jgi:GH15 family glucan-1,4-alpha-glucosidase